MDSTAQTALLTGLTSFKSDMLHLLVLVLPIAGTVLITLGVAGFILRKFLELTGLVDYHSFESEEDQFGQKIKHHYDGQEYFDWLNSHR